MWKSGNPVGFCISTSVVKTEKAETAPRGRLALLPHPFPFFAALATVTALVATNPDEGIRLANLTMPVTVSLLVTFIIWGLGGLFARDRTRRNLIALVVSMPVLLSGYLFGWVRRTGLAAVTTDSLELGLVAVVAVAGILVVCRIPPSADGVARFLNLMTGLLILLATPAIVSVARSEGAVPSLSSTLELTSGDPRPDIYLVVLDAYSGLESLRSVYGFDNSPFLDSLRARGFSVPDRPRANYTKTFLSVGTMLNREHAEALAAAAAPAYRDRRPAYRALEFNRTVVDLKSFGYRFVYIGSSYPPMAVNRLSDAGTGDAISREFESTWTRMTALVPAVRMKCRLLGCARQSAPFEAEDAVGTEGRLSALAAAAELPGPKFVMAHLLLPHGPFRFGPTCEHRSPVWTAGPSPAPDSVVRPAYVDQVICTNLKLLDLIDRIRATSGDSTLIILQSDHGYGRFPGGMPPDLEAAAADQISERFDVFAAYAGPGDVADSMAAYRTPINVFRTAFRVLWGLDEPPLPDLHYWSGTRQPMLLIGVDVD